MSEYLSIVGQNRLFGEVGVAGAKNAALPLLISTLLTSQKCVLANVPDLEDINVTLRLLQSLGANVEFRNGRVSIENYNIETAEAAYGLVKSLRASFWILGPLLARVGKAQVTLPGGDAIGARPVDLHLQGLVKMGADVRMRNGVVCATAPGGLTPQEITFDYPSVGATHHIMMTAALVPGTTVIRGAAREPEVVALAEFLSAMGANVEGAGSSEVAIRGRSELGGQQCVVLGDRIEAATYLIAGAMTGGGVRVTGISGETMGATLDVLSMVGCEVKEGCDFVEVSSYGRLQPCEFSTAPFPGLATDVQPLLMAAMTMAEGRSVIEETVFENRFGHVGEYNRFGADIKIEGSRAIVKGVSKLHGASAIALDIRAAAGLVLMGLAAEGYSQIYDIHHLDRGYASLIEKFTQLGARIQRSPAFDNREVVLGC
ncbi:MAG: UDP-N-acetylglucosamine 1-carboxyvinyltransferase [Deltaproteobacteria bacterium]|nr:UDP-N-acetylglucosamine 1-carboxyvinyltransferase [Deltaproteobacteria bacterium]